MNENLYFPQQSFRLKISRKLTQCNEPEAKTTPCKIAFRNKFNNATVFLLQAAILQQTAEYIYQLEQEKTQLLSQNCQLKRLVNQHEGGDVPIKKRKPDNQGGVVVSLPMHVSESGDEGLGSMSPEPLSVITVTTEGHSVVNSEVVELRRQLERERHARLHLEKQMRAIQSQLYPERFRDNQLITYQPHEVIEHTDNVIAQETEEAVAALQVVSVVSLAPVGTTQTVETSSSDPSSPPLSPQPADMVPEEIKEEEAGPGSPKIVTFGQNQVFSAIDEQTTGDSFSSSSRVTYATSTGEFKNASPQYITTSPSRPAAMKAEPKVEVERRYWHATQHERNIGSFSPTVIIQKEKKSQLTRNASNRRLPSPSNTLDDGSPQARLYLANTSRQNLETIVEAIRHLEGDHLFSDEPAQDVPLALTNKQTANTPSKSTTTSGASPTAKQRLLQAEFLQFHRQQQTQQRPGVIVVKHSLSSERCQLRAEFIFEFTTSCERLLLEEVGGGNAFLLRPVVCDLFKYVHFRIYVSRDVKDCNKHEIEPHRFHRHYYRRKDNV
ncbi:Transcription factor AP-4 [Melipona quadrifasciata]|uniref:Transcription factor AP-4 n=1 Tax=Melipona quadrifasciata TaxID=166423 RepID=A0A0N0BI77_9HYME|nr:Transcription factor AP-4 [Melipona quadrifasciata]